jgi:hypothetical protein
MAGKQERGEEERGRGREGEGREGKRKDKTREENREEKRGEGKKGEKSCTWRTANKIHVHCQQKTSQVYPAMPVYILTAFKLRSSLPSLFQCCCTT